MKQQLERYETLEKEVRAWSLLTKRKMLMKLASLGMDSHIKVAKTLSRIKYSKSKSGRISVEKEDFLYKSLAYNIRKKDGFMESVGFTFARHGIFIETGVGGGGFGGKTKARRVGSAAAAAAKKEWINPVLNPAIGDLANLLAEQFADIATQEISINIPGVMQTKVKG